MKLIVASISLLLGAGAAAAQTPTGPAGGRAPAPAVSAPPAATPSAEDLAAQRRDAEDRLEIMNRQLAALTEIVGQNQRGIVVYPIAMTLPGPIACQGDCLATVTRICTAVHYPRAYAYPAVVPADVIGTFANGVCFGP